VKGILFKDWKVRFIAEHPEEIQTRRLSGLKDINREPSVWTCLGKAGNGFRFAHLDYSIDVKPRYRIGETVYVKEAWAYADGGRVIYKAAESDLSHWEEIIIGQWRSSMSLKAVNARLFLVVQDVRPERVQEIAPGSIDKINFADLCAEGWLGQVDEAERRLPFGSLNEAFEASQWYQQIWDSISPDYPWESNPWVWRYILRPKCVK
jgi:hypothetical protein